MRLDLRDLFQNQISKEFFHIFPFFVKALKVKIILLFTQSNNFTFYQSARLNNLCYLTHLTELIIFCFLNHFYFWERENTYNIQYSLSAVFLLTAEKLLELQNEISMAPLTGVSLLQTEWRLHLRQVLYSYSVLTKGGFQKYFLNTFAYYSTKRSKLARFLICWGLLSEEWGVELELVWWGLLSVLILVGEW